MYDFSAHVLFRAWFQHHLLITKQNYKNLTTFDKYITAYLNI